MYYIDRRKRTLSDWPHVLITVLIGLLCWITCYFYLPRFPITGDDTVLPFWHDLLLWLTNKTVVYVLGMLLMVLTAFIIQRINDIEMLISERTRLVFMFYILLTSTNPGIIPFNNGTIVLLCLVCMIYELFKTFQLPDAKGKLFIVGAYIGIAGLFMPQILWFIPLLWFGMYQLYSLNYKSFMASLAGVLTIYWFVLAWCIWKHDFSMFQHVYASLTDISAFSVFRSSWYHFIGFIFIVLLMVPVLFSIKMDAVSNRMRVRQMLSFLSNMAIWTCILLFLFGKNASMLLSVLYLTLSVLLAYFFENMRNRFYFLLYYIILTFSFCSFVLQLWKY